MSKLNGVVVAEQVVADLDPLALLRDTRRRLAEELKSALATREGLEAYLSRRRKQRDVLRESLLRTSYGYYVAELLDGFTQEQDAHPAMWRLLRETLARLAASQEEMLALAARFYDLHLLALAGYQPQLFTCVACQAALEPVTHYFSIVDGGVLCPKHGEGRVDAEPLPLPLFKALRFIQTREWEQVAQLKLSAGLHGELERLLHGYIVYQLERNVRSAAFLRTIREQVQSVTRNA